MVRIVAVALVVLTLSACSGGAGRLRPETPAGVTLAGTWRLNRDASDDPQAMIERMRQDAMKRMRHRGYLPPMDGAEPADADDDPGQGTERRMPRGGVESGSVGRGERNAEPGGGGLGRFMRRFPYAQALGPVLTSDSLKIEQSPTRFVLIRGEDRRSFTPGGESVVSVAEGVADQHSGWAGREYVIEVRPQVGPRVIERYGLSADGRQLVERFTLTEEGLPKLEFTRVYDRGPLPPRRLPTSN